MERPPLAKDIMVTNLVTLTPDDDVLQAMQRLVKSLDVQTSRERSLLYLSALWERSEAPID